jgi:hypothetical protein
MHWTWGILSASGRNGAPRPISVVASHLLDCHSVRNLTPVLPAHRRVNFWVGLAIASVVVAGVCAALLLTSGSWLTPIAKREILGALQRQYRSDVNIDSLNLTFFPHPHAIGTGLVLRAKDNIDGPPLITLRRFEADASWLGLLFSPHRIRMVTLEGLEIHIARGREKSRQAGDAGRQSAPLLVFEEVAADGTRLEILPRDPGKQPLQFDIYKLSTTSAGIDRPMHYHAQLRNATPPGIIDSTGDFGPWNALDPGETRVTGKYDFANADLGIFRGISGRLSSQGEFQGHLAKIEVKGETDTPDFEVSVGRHLVHLQTSFSATVDGTNGDTLLDSVNAQFGRTTVVARGEIIGEQGVRGKTIVLDAFMKDGDIADVLRLGVKSEPPPMSGRIGFHAKIRIPPGPGDIPDRMELNGQFGITGGRFTNATLEHKLSIISERTRGKTDGAGDSAALSDVGGNFALRYGLVTLSAFAFHIPGAAVRLDGTYGLETERMDFRGTVSTQVRLSQMTTGVKSLLLRLADPLFSRNKAGAVIPIHIGGTRSSPSFGLDIKR